MADNTLWPKIDTLLYMRDLVSDVATHIYILSRSLHKFVSVDVRHSKPLAAESCS